MYIFGGLTVVYFWLKIMQELEPRRLHLHPESSFPDTWADRPRDGGITLCLQITPQVPLDVRLRLTLQYSDGSAITTFNTSNPLTYHPPDVLVISARNTAVFQVKVNERSSKHQRRLFQILVEAESNSLPEGVRVEPCVIGPIKSVSRDPLKDNQDTLVATPNPTPIPPTSPVTIPARKKRKEVPDPPSEADLDLQWSGDPDNDPLPIEEPLETQMYDAMSWIQYHFNGLMKHWSDHRLFELQEALRSIELSSSDPGDEKLDGKCL